MGRARVVPFPVQRVGSLAPRGGSSRQHVAGTGTPGAIDVLASFVPLRRDVTNVRLFFRDGGIINHRLFRLALRFGLLFSAEESSEGHGELYGGWEMGDGSGSGRVKGITVGWRAHRLISQSVFHTVEILHDLDGHCAHQ